MKIRYVLLIALFFKFVFASEQSDSNRFLLHGSFHGWTHTSYQNQSFQSAELLGYFRLSSHASLRFNQCYPLDREKNLRRLLANYVGRQQPFPYGLKSVQFQAQLDTVKLPIKGCQFNRLLFGNFLWNSAQHQYLNFSRYLLHSPLDIEKKRSLADWGIVSHGQIGSIQLEGFCLHSLKRDYTFGWRLNNLFPIHNQIELEPEFYGVIDSRTDSDYNLSYPAGKDKTIAFSVPVQALIHQNRFMFKPFFAINEHRFEETDQIRQGDLRNVEIAITTPPIRNFLGFRFDGILERNAPEYHPNFVYDHDELNDDFWKQTQNLPIAGILQNSEECSATDHSRLVYDRDNVNVRLGESGFETGLKFQFYQEDRSDNQVLTNWVNLGFKYARYQKTGEIHDFAYNDSWLAEFECKLPDQILQFNAAYWRRRTNIINEPGLQSIHLNTWIVGLRWKIANHSIFQISDGDTRSAPTVLTLFFRIDNSLEDYEIHSVEDSGSIFAAALTTSLVKMTHWQSGLQFLYRKYVPDQHISQRIFPPNNVILLSLKFQAIY